MCIFWLNCNKFVSIYKGSVFNNDILLLLLSFTYELIPNVCCVHHIDSNSPAPPPPTKYSLTKPKWALNIPVNPGTFNFIFDQTKTDIKFELLQFSLTDRKMILNKLYHFENINNYGKILHHYKTFRHYGAILKIGLVCCCSFLLLIINTSQTSGVKVKQTNYKGSWSRLISNFTWSPRKQLFLIDNCHYFNPFFF